MPAVQRISSWRLGVACALAVFVLAACGGAERDDSGEIVEAGDLGVFSLRVGDCFDDPPGFLSEELTELSEVDAVPCSGLHDNEVYAVGDHPAGDDAPYPGNDAIEFYSFAYCLSEFDLYVGLAYADSRLDLSFIFPLEGGWEGEDDREVVCFLYDLDLQKLTGSMKGSGE